MPLNLESIGQFLNAWNACSLGRWPLATTVAGTGGIGAVEATPKCHPDSLECPPKQPPCSVTQCRGCRDSSRSTLGAGDDLQNTQDLPW